MRLFRQLGTWGTAAALAPLLWLLACASARSLAQHAYDTSLSTRTKAFRAQAGPRVKGGAEGRILADPMALTEVQKYVHVWALEPGACSAFPDAARFPWCWNPFRPSALLLRLKQKQAFLWTQRHEVERLDLGGDRTLYYLAPDPRAALGGRRFFAETDEGKVLRVVEP